MKLVSFNRVWMSLISHVLARGRKVNPRGTPTLELPQHTINVDMRRCVLTIPERKLNYKFMAREAFWILTGDDKVENISPWNSNIAKFSDDGVRFFGAYGPKVVAQLDYVVGKLVEDPDTRQAGLTIWRENPPATKDVPCTVAIFFAIREGMLEVNVFMRSNDVWLGTPYDVFNFSMLGHLVCSRLNAPFITQSNTLRKPIVPGVLRLTAASSHLYMTNERDVTNIIVDHATKVPVTQPTPEAFYLSPPSHLLDILEHLSVSDKSDPARWWKSDDEESWA